MDRSWNEACRMRECGHAPDDHLATPELAAQSAERVVWCQACRRHEVVLARRGGFPFFSLRAGRSA